MNPQTYRVRVVKVRGTYDPAWLTVCTGCGWHTYSWTHTGAMRWANTHLRRARQR